MFKFVTKLGIYILLILLYCFALFSIIDPYNVYHWKNIRDNGIEPNKNYIKTTYIIANPDKFDSFILGSSRVGALHVEKISNRHTYNMTYAQATVAEELETLKELIRHNVNIKTVYVGVDNISFCDRIDYHAEEPLLCSYKSAQSPFNYFKVFLNPCTCFKSLFNHGNISEGFDTFYEYGWDIDYNRTSNYDWDSITPFINERNDESYVLECLRNIKQLCDDNEIKLIVFTNPMYDITYKAAVDYNNYYSFLKDLSKITDYYNFSSLNDITLDNSNYIEWSHYKAEIGDIMLNYLDNPQTNTTLYAQGFGWHVTEENINDLLSLLRNQYQ